MLGRPIKVFVLFQRKIFFYRIPLSTKSAMSCGVADFITSQKRKTLETVLYILQQYLKLQLSKIRPVSLLLILTIHEVRKNITHKKPFYCFQTMGSKNHITIFAAIVLCLLLHFPSQTEAHGVALLSQVCKQSQNYQSCVQILTSQPRAIAAPSAKAIAEISLALARKDAIDTCKFFDGLARKTPASKAALEKCASFFKEAVIFLNLKGLEGGTASLDVHNALDQATYCEDALSSGRVNIPSAAARILKWKAVYAVADAAVVAVEN